MLRTLGAVSSVCALVLALTACMPTWAEDKGHAEKLAIGDAVPDFTLKDLEGKEHKLSDYKGKIVVLDFVSHGCPWSRAHDKSMPALAEKYKANDVVVLGVEADKENSVEDISSYAKENGVTYTILKDEGNKFADAVNAKQTPEIFIVDKEGNLAYHGAYDDRKSPDAEGATNYVAAALDALLAEKPIEMAQTKAWGCGIKRVSS